MSYNYDEIIKMLKQNEQQQINMAVEANQYFQAGLKNIHSNFQTQMVQIQNELQDICTRSSFQQQEITIAFDTLNNKVMRIYENTNNYPQLQNINYFCTPNCLNNLLKSPIESIIHDAVKSVLCNFVKVYLSR